MVVRAIGMLMLRTHQQARDPTDDERKGTHEQDRRDNYGGHGGISGRVTGNVQRL
jgi:hypothetical protein